MKKHTIEGRVVGADGAPAGDALLSIVESSVVMPELTQKVDASGRFKMSLPAGSYTFEAVSADGKNKARTTLDVADAAASVVVELPL